MHSSTSKDRPSSASCCRTIASGKSSFLERNNNNNDILSSTAFHSSLKHDSTRVPQKDSGKVDSLPPSGSARSAMKNSAVRVGIEMREKTTGRQEQRSVLSSSLEIKLTGPLVNTDSGRRVSSGVEMMSRFAPRPYRPVSADSKVVRTRSQSVEVHTLSGSRSGLSAGVIEGQSGPRGRLGVVADDSKVGQLARNFSPAPSIREPIKTNVTLSSNKSPVSKVSSSSSGASTAATAVLVTRQNKDVPLANNLMQNTSSLHHGSQVKGESLVKSNGKVPTATPPTMNSVNCGRTATAGISLASGPKSSDVTTSSSTKPGGLPTGSVPPRQSHHLPPQQTNSQTVTMSVSLKATAASSLPPSKVTNDKKASSSSSSPASAISSGAFSTIPPSATTTTRSLGDTTRTTTVHSSPAVSSKESPSSGQTMKPSDALLKGHHRDASLVPSEIPTKPSTSSNDRSGTSSSTGGSTIKHRAVIKSGPESLLFPTSCPGPTMASSQKLPKDSISTVRDNSNGSGNKTVIDGATVKTSAALENTIVSASRLASSLSSTASAASINSSNSPSSNKSKQSADETSHSLSSPPSSTQSNSSSSKSSLSSSPSNTVLNNVASSTPTAASPNGCEYEPESPVSPTDSLIVIDSPVSLPTDPQRKLNAPTGLRLSTKIDTSNDSVSSALSVLMKRQSVSGSMVPASPKCSYRYGSRGAISSIYQNKLGSGASSQYNKNMTDLYGDFFRNMKDCRSVVKDAGSDAPSLEARSQPDQASMLKTFPVGPDSVKTFEVKPTTRDDSSLPVAHSDQVSLNLYLCPTSSERRSRCNAPQPIRRVLSCDSAASTSSSSSSSSSSQVRGRSPSLAASSETRRLFFEGASSEVVKPDDVVQLNGVVDRSPSPGSAYDPPLGGQTSFIDDPGADICAAEAGGGGGGGGVAGLGVVTVREATKRRSKRKQRVSFEPVSLLLNAALEGELDLVKITIPKVRDAMVSNESGVTALHNSVFSGHHDVCRFLIDYGCTVNITDADGWTPLHCAASCNNVEMVKLLVQNGACLFAMTFNDRQIPVEKCNRQLGGYDDCNKYLSEQSQAIGVANGGVVYATSDYNATGTDELSFRETDQLRVVRKGDDAEMEWWWAKPVNQPTTTKQGYVPRNYLSMYPAKPKLTVKN